MKVLSEGYTIKDLTFVGITAALCIILGVIVRGILGIFIGKVPGIENLILGISQGIILVIGFLKVDKRFFLTLVGLCMGVFYGFIFPAHPFLLVTFLVAGILGDLMVLLPFNRIRPLVAVTVFRVTSGALGVLLAHWIGFSQTKLVWFLIVINTFAMAIGSMVGAFLGMKLVKEIQKVGFLGIKSDVAKTI